MDHSSSGCTYDENPNYVDFCIKCRGALREYPDGTDMCPRFGLTNLDEKSRTTVHCMNCWSELHHKISPIKFEWISNDIGILRCSVHGKWVPYKEEYEKFLHVQKIASSNDGTSDDFIEIQKKFPGNVGFL